MLLLLIIIVNFFWLVVGAVQFLGCVAVPRYRRIALSSALWWACWGPCIVALLMFAGLVFAAESMEKSDGLNALSHAPSLIRAFGSMYLLVGLVGTMAVSTSVAWLHQVVIQRLPFRLFRVYATIVSAGVGSVFGWCLSWWMLAQEFPHTWLVSIPGMIALLCAFGWLGFRVSPALQGRAPDGTPQEASLNY